VRSDRNSVIVDFDRPSPKAAPYVLPPASRTNGGGAAPDAMLALKESPAPDPIAVLGLDGSVGGPSASSTSIVSAPPIPQPVMIQGTSPMAARQAAVPQQPPAPAPTTPTDQLNTGSRGRQFTGHPISLDFQGADLRAVLRTFAEISGLNIVIDPAVQGTVDVALRDVPWDQALDIILRANKLGYSVDGTIVRIAPNAVLKAEEDERKALLDSQNDASQLGTLQRQLSYAKGEEVATLLKSANVLTKRGQANVDPRTNTLIVRDVPSQFPEITSLIDGIDRAQPQVEIEARIVQTNKTYARALGVQWGFGARVDPSLGNTTNLAFPNNGSLGGRAGGVQGPATGSTTGQPTAVNLNVPGASSGVGLALGSVNGAFNLDVALSALESSGNGRLLSTPRVTTQNNVAAEMTQGVQIPIQTVSNNTVTVSFKDAALTLKVTPQITSANTVIMLISVENATPDFSRQVNNIPP
jgi:type IV pilus assembly protein PilQ